MARWDRIQRRGNVEDRRGMGTRGRVAVGGGGLGLVGIIIVVLFSVLGGGGGDMGQILNQLQTEQAPAQPVDEGEFEGLDSYEDFAGRVLGSNDELWETVFSANQLTYSAPRLVLFRGATESGCGGANAQVGPHYCPLDETIYLDETFFDELTSRFGARGGEVAEAYVLAHEVGHHVQNELNIMDEVQRLQQQAGSREEANQLSVRLELQADCFAGVWANSVADAQVITQAEIGQAIDAAAAVGDDRIQEAVQGRVTPENWTHGSSEDRVAWFTKGFETGDPGQCDTFA
jgi:hypothetical protein